ncbi:DgyrCDS4637 [Dimorphilus gyrociliatus]|uniref:DgyrCDS4637 n=1 Tax=Dimorphilus gyrociliatus TaxID=2664684 RepID=A0A7I8VJS3_9ANNE|nr:DgyrCDS4637 [Dimorphilus gyrociliatus]
MISFYSRLLIILLFNFLTNLQADKSKTIRILMSAEDDRFETNEPRLLVRHGDSLEFICPENTNVSLRYSTTKGLYSCPTNLDSPILVDCSPDMKAKSYLFAVQGSVSSNPFQDPIKCWDSVYFTMGTKTETCIKRNLKLNVTVDCSTATTAYTTKETTSWTVTNTQESQGATETLSTASSSVTIVPTTISSGFPLDRGKSNGTSGLSDKSVLYIAIGVSSSCLIILIVISSVVCLVRRRRRESRKPTSGKTSSDYSSSTDNSRFGHLSRPDFPERLGNEPIPRERSYSSVSLDLEQHRSSTSLSSLPDSTKSVSRGASSRPLPPTPVDGATFRSVASSEHQYEEIPDWNKGMVHKQFNQRNFPTALSHSIVV